MQPHSNAIHLVLICSLQSTFLASFCTGIVCPARSALPAATFPFAILYHTMYPRFGFLDSLPLPTVCGNIYFPAPSFACRAVVVTEAVLEV